MKKRLPLTCLILLGVLSFANLTVSAENTLLAKQAEAISKTAEALLLLPDHPHERNRNRELATVVEFLIDSHDLERAQSFRAKITNWRADQLKAKIATAYYESGKKDLAEKMIKEVSVVADTVTGWKAGMIAATGEHKNYFDKYDDFRLDRIKVALAEYCWISGDKEAAKKWSENVLPAEQSDFIKKQALALAEADYDASLAINMILAEGETFEGKKAAVDGVVLLYGLYFKDAEKRDHLKSLIDRYSISMPIMYRVEWLHDMALAADENGDAELARSFYHEASLFISQSEFRPRLFFPLKASNIITAHKLQFEDEALEAAKLLYKTYGESEGSIYNIHRADVLCSIGEVFAFIGKMDRAEQVYLNALDQAVVNPNSKPRLEDLNLITLSLVEYDVPLTPSLNEEMNGLIKSLGTPW